MNIIIHYTYYIHVYYHTLQSTAQHTQNIMCWNIVILNNFYFAYTLHAETIMNLCDFNNLHFNLHLSFV